MTALVSLTELKDYLGDAPASADDALLTALITEVQSLFEAETGRPAGGYIAAANGLIEVHDGTSSHELYLEYPLAASGLTSVILGFDTAAPDETLNVADKQIIVYGANSRRIVRTDGGWFGRVQWPRYVQVTYNHVGDFPDNAKLAIESVCAVAYRRRGSEEVSSETIGNYYSRTMLQQTATEDAFWQAAVAANRRLAFA